MDEDKIKELYEKLYFSEVDNKEKIHSRIQVVFGLIVITSTISSYILKNTDLNEHCMWAAVTISLSALSFIPISIACWRLKNAFWGNDFRYIPKPIDIEKYHSELIEYERKYIEYCDSISITYNNEHNPNSAIQTYLQGELIRCTSHNIEKNEIRASQIYESIRYFFYSLIPLSLAVMLFLVMDLDSASPRKSNTPHYIIVPVQTT